VYVVVVNERSRDYDGGEGCCIGFRGSNKGEAAALLLLLASARGAQRMAGFRSMASARDPENWLPRCAHTHSMIMQMGST